MFSNIMVINQMLIMKFGSHDLYRIILFPVVWNPWVEKAKEISDFGDDEFPNMVCVESGHVSSPVILLPGTAFEASQILQVSQLNFFLTRTVTSLTEVILMCWGPAAHNYGLWDQSRVQQFGPALHQRVWNFTGFRHVNKLSLCAAVQLLMSYTFWREQCYFLCVVYCRWCEWRAGLQGAQGVGEGLLAECHSSSNNNSNNRSHSS